MGYWKDYVIHLQNISLVILLLKDLLKYNQSFDKYNTTTL